MKHLRLLIFVLLLSMLSQNSISIGEERGYTNPGISPNTYEPEPSSLIPLNVKEQMTLSPMFTPDNALDIHVAWIDRANSTIEIQNQYITQFDDGETWANDPSPLVRAIVNAKGRGVSIRVQVNEDDSDDVATYFNGLGITTRYMGTSISSSGNNYLSATHNKLLLIDDKVTLLSSINFGENAFTNNREAGMVIQSATVTAYYKSFFEADWGVGEEPNLVSLNNYPKSKTEQINYVSHTNIPRSNFTGIYNVSAFVNPDNAEKFIFDTLKTATESIFVSMYTISNERFTNTLVDLKKANPSLDIQVLISNRRVGGSENIDTHAAASEMVKNLIPVYNSTKDDDKVDGFYHNKYWIIDGKHTFVYSGNWSPRSVSAIPEDGDFASGDVNRDMGIAVFDATDIAGFYKDVWDQDVAVADAWDLPVGITQTSFKQTEVISGTIQLSATVSGLNITKASYAFSSDTTPAFTEVDLDEANSFSVSFDTSIIDNGITKFEVKAGSDQIFTDSVDVNVINLGPNDNWRLLITEIHPNPDVVSDVEGEFFEITNSFPFALLIEDWQVGDDNDLFTFGSNYQIAATSSLIFARNPSGFSSAFGVSADEELDFSLVNGGDLVQLLNSEGNYVDIVAYGDETAADGSETVDIPDAGKSISRKQLHIDTNKASDFEFANPSPKGAVPTIPLGLTSQSPSESDTAIEPYPFLSMLLALPMIRRKRS